MTSTMLNQELISAMKKRRTSRQVLNSGIDSVSLDF